MWVAVQWYYLEDIPEERISTLSGLHCKYWKGRVNEIK
jgi:hypothetical protein